MSQPIWVAFESLATGRLRFCPTYGKWVASKSATSLWESVDGFKWTNKTTTVPFTIIDVAGTDTGSTAGNLVVITTGTSRIYEMDSSGVWTNRTPALSGTFSKLDYLPGIGFIVVGVRLGNPVNWLSTDGVTWTGPYAHTMANTTPFLGTPGFMCAGSGAGSVEYSPDGVGWTVKPMGLGTNQIDGLTYVPPISKWIGYGHDAGHTKTLIYSCAADGTGFALIKDFGAGTFSVGQQITYEPHSGYIVLFGDNASKISTDGVNWTDIAQFVTGISWLTADFYTIAGKVIAPYSSNIAIMVADDYGYSGYLGDGFLEDGTYLPPTNPSIIDNGPGDFDFKFDLPNEPKVQKWNVVRQDGLGNQVIIDVIDNSAAPGPQDIHDVTTPGVYTYIAFGVDSTNLKLTSIISASTVVPDITVVGSGGISFGGAPAIVFISDPSGIYTLVVNQTHDVLINRAGGVVSSLNIAIPTPFGKTGYLGGNS